MRVPLGGRGAPPHAPATAASPRTAPVAATDRHVKTGNGDRVCFLWEGNELRDDATMTYKQVG